MTCGARPGSRSSAHRFRRPTPTQSPSAGSGLRVYIEHYNAHRPHRALGLQPPDPLSNLPSVARIRRPKSTGVTCSADSYTSTDELHERICAPYGLVERANGYLETSLLPGRRPPWTADSVKLVA
jgi:hypothetical protein